MARYIDADNLLAELQEEIDFKTAMYTEEQNQYFTAGLKCAYRDVKSQPTADVAPKSEIANLLSDLKKAVHDKAVYPHNDEYAFVNLKVFDAVIQDFIKKAEGIDIEQIL